jgi:hypothetical protein
MTNLNELLNELKENIYDTSEDFIFDYSASDSAYICDAITEFADSQVDIYYSDRAKWFGEHWDLVNDANDELGSTGDVMQDIAQAQFLYYERQLSGDIENIVLALASQYLIDNGLAELNDAQLNNLNHITYQIDENSNLDDIADYCNENILHKGGEE